MKNSFKLEGLDCAVCAAKIERAVQGVDGVKSASVNFMTEKMVIDGDESKIDQIISTVTKLVKKLEPDVKLKKV